MASISIIKHQLVVVIKRFKFEELEDAVMPIFPEISWNQVRSKLIKNHKTFNVTNAACVIEETLNSINVTKHDLYNRLEMLQVTDISRHDKKKIWYGYELTGLNKPVNYLKKWEFERNIKKEFDAIDIHIDVKVIMHDNIMFVCIKERQKRKRAQLVMPIFFALFLEHKHFFCSKKDISLDFLRVMAVILGYTNSKRINLMGRDLRSLMRLLWIKQQGVLCAENISQPPVFKPPDLVVTKYNGIDYTQNKQRRDYIEQCFGKEPPTFELLIIRTSDQSIQHDDLASKLPTDSIHMNWEFRSRNIPKFLSNLVEKRVFMFPLPEYVSNLMTLGKTELKLRTG